MGKTCACKEPIAADGVCTFENMAATAQGCATGTTCVETADTKYFGKACTTGKTCGCKAPIAKDGVCTKLSGCVAKHTCYKKDSTAICAEADKKAACKCKATS